MNEKTWTIDYKTTILKVIKLIITRAQKVHILEGHNPMTWIVILSCDFDKTQNHDPSHRIVILITSASTVSSVKCELHANEIKVEKYYW